MKLLTVAELLATPLDPRIEAAELLEDAAEHLRCGLLDAAAWRLADAAKLMCRLAPNAEGVATPTKRGGLIYA